MYCGLRVSSFFNLPYDKNLFITSTLNDDVLRFPTFLVATIETYNREETVPRLGSDLLSSVLPRRGPSLW